MKSFKLIFEEFFDFGDRFAFDMLDGFQYEGYPFEIFDDSFSFHIGGPLALDEPIIIKFEDVNMNCLYFVKFRESGWKRAKWDDNTKKWIITFNT
ncbi:MAG: hypothetical protein N3B21_14050 [Clostridia bacterium]|nr:hypothetical protein [Clostridia bacterium]